MLPIFHFLVIWNISYVLNPTLLTNVILNYLYITGVATLSTLLVLQALDTTNPPNTAYRHKNDLLIRYTLSSNNYKSKWKDNQTLYHV